MAQVKKDDILNVSKNDQYKTIKELFKKNESNSAYYALLILSVFIVAIGLLLGNTAIVVGGMLVAPLLTPILIIALGISTGEIKAVKRSGILVLKSIGLVLGISFAMAVFFGQPVAEIYLFDDAMKTGVLYFIVALVSGIAATFAWIRKETNEILPGVAVAVSLLPPLAMLGISIAVFDIDMMRFTFLIFLSNFIGIVLGSMVVFSLLKFHKTDKQLVQVATESENNSH